MFYDMTWLERVIFLKCVIKGGVVRVLTSFSGSPPIILANALAEKLALLVQYGKCSQASTPTPASPVDIYCNNGKLVASTNLFRTTGSKYKLNGVTYEPQPDGSVKCYGTATGYSTWMMGRADVNSDMGTVTLAINGTYDSVGNIVAAGTNLKDSSGNTLYVIPWTNWTRSASVDLSEYPDCAYIEVSLKRNSNKVTNATIKVSVTKGSTVPTWRPYKGIRIVGTPEVISVSEQTASATDLFAVGDYKDEQEIISGAVTRSCGIKVLDGTEEWTTDTYGGYRRMVLQEVLTASSDTLSVVCSHYVSRSADVRQQPNSIFIASSGKTVIYVDSTQTITTVDGFNAWLAQQYANGTPVVIIYPLATETEENVDPQEISINKGTNTLTVTAEVSGIEFEGKYWAKEE